MASLRCHGDSDWDKTQIIRNFHLYIIQLWSPFFPIFTHGDLVNAQTWEVFPQKHPVQPPWKHEREKVCWSRYFSRGLRGKSRKQEDERENETRCEIAGNVFEKRKERRAKSARHRARRIKQKELKKAGQGNKDKAAVAITGEEVDILYENNMLGVSSAESLLNTVWLNNTIHFGIRGCQEHRDLCWGDVKLCKDTQGNEYLVYNKRQTKNKV